MEPNTAHDKEMEDLKTQIESHLNGDHETAEQETYECREEGKIYPKFYAHGDKCFGLECKFEWR